MKDIKTDLIITFISRKRKIMVVNTFKNNDRKFANLTSAITFEAC